MLTPASYTTAIRKACQIILLATGIGFGHSALSQGRASDQLIFPFGVALTKNGPNITLDEMLKKPVLESRVWEIKEFAISYIPEGKDFMGPFTVKGPRLKGQALEVLQRIKERGDKHVRVFIENIKAMGPDSTIRHLSPIAFNSVN